MNLTPETIAEVKRLDGLIPKGPWSRLDESDDIVAGLIEQKRGSARYKASICRVESGSIEFGQLFDPYYNDEPFLGEDGEEVDLAALTEDEVAEYRWPWTGDFIALARTALPAAVTQIEELQADLATIRAEMLADREIKKRLEQENAKLKRRIEAAPQCIARAVAEIPDRFSPEDQPEMMLVTPEELQRIVAAYFDESQTERSNIP